MTTPEAMILGVAIWAAYAIIDAAIQRHKKK